MKLSLNKKILFILIASILVLVAKVIFRNTPELIGGGQIIFDDIIYDLAIAYIGSAIFYYLVVYFPQQRDRQNILRYTLPHTRDIYDYGIRAIREMMRSANYINFVNKDEFTLEEIHDVCQKLHPYGDAPMKGDNVDQQATWMEYYYEFSKSINLKADKVLRFAYCLDSEYIKHVNLVVDNYFLRQLPIYIIKGSVGNEDISFLANAIHEFQKDILLLKAYIEKNYN